MQIAALHTRIIAKLVDLLVIFTSMFFILYLIEPLVILDANPYLVVIIFLTLVMLADSIKGQSLGKRLFKMKVIEFHTQKPIGLIRSIIRNSLFLLNFFILPIAINYILYVSYYRTLSDFLTGTCVISTKNTSQQPI